MALRTAQPAVEPVLRAFAERLRDHIGALRVLLFGSRARGDAREDSDYDVIVVSPRFDGVSSLRRGIGLSQYFYEVGGEGGVDIICLTPEEFERASRMITLVNAVLPEAIDLLQPRNEPPAESETIAGAQPARP